MRINVAALTRLIFTVSSQTHQTSQTQWVYDADGRKHKDETIRNRYDDIAGRMPRLVQRTIRRRYADDIPPERFEALMIELGYYDDMKNELDDIANYYSMHFRMYMEDVYTQIAGVIAPYADNIIGASSFDDSFAAFDDPVFD